MLTIQVCPLFHFLVCPLFLSIALYTLLSYSVKALSLPCETCCYHAVWYIGLCFPSLVWLVWGRSYHPLPFTVFYPVSWQVYQPTDNHSRRVDADKRPELSLGSYEILERNKVRNQTHSSFQYSWDIRSKNNVLLYSYMDLRAITEGIEQGPLDGQTAKLPPPCYIMHYSIWQI